MKNELKLLLLFLLLNYISPIEEKLSNQESEAINIEPGKTVEYNIYQNSFKFEYSGDKSAVYFFPKTSTSFTLTDPNGNKSYLERNDRQYISTRSYIGELNYKGTYFLNVECGPECLIGGTFTFLIPGKITEIIDLSKNVYYYPYGYETNTNSTPITYKVSNINEKKSVCFILMRDIKNSYHSYYPYYPYYPDEPNPYDPETTDESTDKTDVPNPDEPKKMDGPIDLENNEEETDKSEKANENEEPEPTDDDVPVPKPDYPDYDYESFKLFKNLTIFEVCDDTKNECKKHVKIYTFEPNHEYTIKIHLYKYQYKRDDSQMYYEPEYIQETYMFFPISNKNFKQLSENDLGIIDIEGPNFYTITNPKKQLFVLYSELEDELILMFSSKTNNTIDLENIESISDLSFKRARRGLEINPNNSVNEIIFVYPSDLVSKTKIYFIDSIESDKKDSFTIPAGSNKIFFFHDGEEEEKGQYYVTTYHSEKGKLKLDFSDIEEGTDKIVQNYYPFPILAQKEDVEYKVNVKKYLARYALFGVVDPYFYKSFLNFGKNMLKNLLGADLENYKLLSQQNFRISNQLLPLFEFYNAYINGIDIKLNFYFRQIYGWTDVYECDKDDVSLDDLTKLTKPINNYKCKNKKSIFDRLFSFNGDKILAGYLAPDSYYDLYVEIDKDSDVIEINPLLTSQLQVDSTANFLKKGITYKINFHLSHKIKLEPGYNANIIISNGQTTSTINTQYPTTEISGKNFTIKSDIDAMVYFFGKLPTQVANQVKIENRPGTYIKFSGVREMILLDFGFEGFLPSTYPFDFKVREDGTYYLGNLYNKLKRPLVPDEYLYAYYWTDTNKNLKIEYINNNLNVKNDDFNIFLIPENSGENKAENALIISVGFTQLMNTIHFCYDDTRIELSLVSEYEIDENYEPMIITPEQNETFSLNLRSYDNKLSFRTNRPFVYSYSLYDGLDKEIFDRNRNWKNETKELTDWSITEAKSENDKNNKIRIKFKPNYKNAQTRYIIIAAKKTEAITEEKFNDFCYIAELLNQRPEGITVDYIYEVGDTDLMEAEIDISSIVELNKTENFIINIISQKLRYDRKINIYTSKVFEHTGRKNSDDEHGESDIPVTDVTDIPTSDSTNTTDIPTSDDTNTTDIPTSDSTNNTDIPGSEDGSKEKDDGGLKGSSLALAVVVPILGVIIIILIVMVILAHKRTSSKNSSEKIELMASM